MRQDEHSSYSVQDSAQSDAMMAGTEPYRNMHLRYVTTQDAQSACRENWLIELGLPFDRMDMALKAEILLTSALGDYDVIVIGSRDYHRILSFIRENKPVFMDRIVIALCTESSARSRAQLISAGADDVFDTSHQHPEEARARMHAIKRRYDEARRPIDDEQQINSVVNLQFATSKQRAIIEYLLNSPDRSATYHSLCFIAGDIEPVSLNHLKVIISNLRKILTNSCKITSDRINKYTLIIED